MSPRPSATLVLALLPALPLAAQPPNVLLVVADDVGIDQITAYRIGTAPPPTPTIDALAARGVRFDNAWANPLCAPTRACIMTGRYCFRTGVGAAQLHHSGALPFSETTIPELLDAAGSGYAHAAFGKWHLSDRRNGGIRGPNLAGWSHYAGALDGTPSYYRWQRVEDGEQTTSRVYNTTATVDDALAWIESAPEPWMCYVAFPAAHRPFEVPPPTLHGYGRPKSPLTKYKAMIQAMDTEIGRLLAGLGDRLARTDVLFTADNGTPSGFAEGPFPASRGKGTPYQGGLLVPLIVAGPAVRAPGRTVEAMVCAVDLFATAVELCGVRPFVPFVQIDGVSTVPYLRDPAQPPLRTHAFAEFYRGEAPRGAAKLAIRDERYKLLRWTWQRREELYDLWLDPWESDDLLAGGTTPAARVRWLALRERLRRLRAMVPSIESHGSQACRGSSGVPRIDAEGVPRIGGRYRVMLRGGPRGRPAVLTIGASDREGFGVSLPFPLERVGGGPGCLLHASAELTLPVTTDRGGGASALVAVPPEQVLAGGTVFHAWAASDPGAPENALGVVTSGALRIVLGSATR